MAQLMALGIQQHGHKFPIFFLQRRIGINVNNLDFTWPQTRLAAQTIQRGEHVMAKMAIIAAEQPQGQLIYQLLP